MDFKDIVIATGPVESWLKTVEIGISDTIRHDILKLIETYPTDGRQRNEWLFSGAAQSILAVDQIMWTQGAQNAIQQIENQTNKNALKEFLQFSNEQINAMVALIRGNLNSLQRCLMSALIVLDVHGRDVIKKLIETNASSINDFQWTKLLRYYWDTEEMHVKVRQTTAVFTYGYEYLGNSPRLVITPLTDICYLTLTGALHLKFGGAPAGPAGTGKTESVKDLAKALAIQCVVFNCSDSLDTKMMGQFFSGLAAAGAWACFDEFNRINIEVLSVIAQQMLTIVECLKSQKVMCVFWMHFGTYFIFYFCHFLLVFSFF